MTERFTGELHENNQSKVSWWIWHYWGLCEVCGYRMKLKQRIPHHVPGWTALARCMYFYNVLLWTLRITACLDMRSRWPQTSAFVPARTEHFLLWHRYLQREWRDARVCFCKLERGYKQKVWNCLISCGARAREMHGRESSSRAFHFD